MGVGGDLSYNALRRLDRVTARAPDQVVILLGANDLLMTVFPRLRGLMGLAKRLPRDPSLTWLEENLRAIVQRVRSETSARIGLVSLADVGEAPESKHPVQAQLNRLYADAAARIRTIASDESIEYLPFYERFHEALVREPGRALTGFRFLPFYVDTFRYYVLRESSDDISARNGWRFHVDGIHLNRRGGLILAEVVQRFLDAG